METSAINANTILVTFEGIEEPVEIELEEALVHGQTEVTFVYNEVEYTAELTEAYVDPEVEAEEKLAAAITAAEEAIAALPTVEEVAIEDAQAVADAKALVEAVKALDAEAVVEGEEVIAELEAKIEELKAEQDAEEALAAATEAVVLAEESELQADVDAALALVNALPEGEDKDALVARLAVVQEAIDERVAAEEALAAATDAVVLAEESLLEADLADARELVDALEASDAKTLLQARINSVQLQIQGIIAAVNNANTEVKLYNALNIKPFVNVDVEKIRDYDTALAARNFTTIAAIQTIIDTVNANAVNTDITTLVNNADTAVQAAETTPNGLVGGSGPKTLIEKAQEEIDKLPTEIPEAVATALNVNVTVKADLQERLDAVKVVVPVLEATNQIELLAALQNKAFDRVNEDLIATYQSSLNPTTDITIALIQTMIDTQNQTAATSAVGIAEGSLDVADVEAAQVLVNYLPEDVAPATTKADLQDRLDVVNAVITLDAATTEAGVLSALKAEALDLNNINDVVATKYKAIVDGLTLAYNTNLQTTVVDAGNTAALTEALSELVTAATNLDATDNAANREAFTAKLQKLADVTSHETVANKKFVMSTIDENLLVDYATQMVTDNGSSTFATVADVQGSVTTINNGADALARLAAVNAATDAYEMRTALTAVAIAESDGYVDLTSQEKLEVAELVLVARANETDEEFANTTAVTTAISTATSARSTFLTNVNAATSISTMVTALDVVEFPEFQDLGDLEQVEVAELVLNALNELKADDSTAEFETISEIKAAAGL